MLLQDQDFLGLVLVTCTSSLSPGIAGVVAVAAFEHTPLLVDVTGVKTQGFGFEVRVKTGKLN